jgi:hypothetical protein
MSLQELHEALEERRRRAGRPWRVSPHMVYSPRLRRDQIKALHYLKRLEGRPMTKLAQEAVDRFLEQYGGVADVIARGVAEFGDRGKKAHHESGAR